MGLAVDDDSDSDCEDSAPTGVHPPPVNRTNSAGPLPAHLWPVMANMASHPSWAAALAQLAQRGQQGKSDSVQVSGLRPFFFICVCLV